MSWYCCLLPTPAGGSIEPAPMQTYQEVSEEKEKWGKPNVECLNMISNVVTNLKCEELIGTIVSCVSS